MPYSSFHRVANTYRRPLKACAAALVRGQRGDKWLSSYPTNMLKTLEVVPKEKNANPLSTLLNEQKFSTRFVENITEHLSQSPLPVAISYWPDESQRTKRGYWLRSNIVIEGCDY